VDNHGNMINSQCEKFIEKVVNDKSFQLNINNFDLISKVRIYIGRDTRQSGLEITNSILLGIKSINSNIDIVNLEFVTTPQHHYLTKYNYEDKLKYIKFYGNAFLDWSPQMKLLVDCSNGVGSLTLGYLLEYYEIYKIKLFNIEIKEYHKLNYESGSDYVLNNCKIPMIESENLMASIDGDADRLIFYFKEDKLNILDGDYISALYSLCCLKTVCKYNYSIGVIHTAYTNKAFINFIENKAKEYKCDINIICTATGVKNLHSQAIKYDIGIYFESNGHGTIIFDKKLDNLPYFNIIKKLNNFVVGDAISGIFCVLYSLEYLDISFKDWYNFFKKNKFILYKKKVKNKNSFITTINEEKLIEPNEVQLQLDIIMNECNCFIFIRPSGTEDVIRIYIELFNNKENEILDLQNKISNIIKKYEI
jgi:phosphoacetylglucosamine mutase